MFDRILLWSHLVLDFCCMFFSVQRMRELDGITNVMDVNLGKLQEMVRNRQVWQAAVHGVAREFNATRQLNSMYFNHSFNFRTCDCLFLFSISYWFLSAKFYLFKNLSEKKKRICPFFSWWVWLMVCHFYLLKEPALL